MTRPSAWQAGATPTCAASGWTAIKSAFRVRGSIPAARQLFPARPGSCARCATRAPGEPLALERAHLRIQRVAFGRFRAALLRGQLPQRALAPRLAPSRQMRAVQPLAAKQAAHLAGLCAAIRLLQNPQPILCGELAPLRLGHNLRVRGRSGAAGPGASSLRSSTPRAGTETSFNVIESPLCDHRFSPPPPTEIPKVAGVSVMLAEREAGDAAGGCTAAQEPQAQDNPRVRLYPRPCKLTV